MSGLAEDSWILTSASAFNLLPYTSCSLWKTLPLVISIIVKTVLTSSVSLKQSWGPTGVQGPHLWELLC